MQPQQPKPETVVAPKPAPLKPLTHNERLRIFGRFDFTPAPVPGNPEAIQIRGNWASQNIVMVETPQLMALGRPRVPFHWLGARQLQTLLSAWEAAGLTKHLKTWDGSWTARYKRGKSGGTHADLSNHSWGTAFDVNARWNGLGKVPAQLGEVGCVRELVPLAEAHGFAWGGHFRTPDGMHFELARLNV